MEFKLPEIGEGVHEGELIKWLVNEGDQVEADQPLLEVMTDKATVEVPSPVAGVIKNLQSKEGEMIKVGGVLANIEEGAGTAKKEDSSAEASKSESKAAPQAAAQAPQAPASVSSESKTSAPQVQTNGNGVHAQKSAQSFAGGAGQAAPYQGALESLTPSSIPAAPIVRAMAQKSGVNLAEVPASGPKVGDRNRVLEHDLLNYLQQSQAPAQGASPSGMQMPGFARPMGGEEEERQPVRGLRRVIAQAMVRSKYTAPHYAYVDEFECSKLVELRKEAKKIGQNYDVNVTYLPFVVKAVVAALKEFPIVNSSLVENDNGMELVYKKYYHIGIAVATKDGLVVPVIKHADQKSLLQIAAEMAELSQKVRDGKASSEELRGSTFSITSMGNIGGLFATPIINHPEVGILGVYKIQDKPIVKDGQIVAGKTMHLSASFDHRVVDGAVGGYFCNAIIERLQNPARLLMDMI